MKVKPHTKKSSDAVFNKSDRELIEKIARIACDWVRSTWSHSILFTDRPKAPTDIAKEILDLIKSTEEGRK